MRRLITLVSLTLNGILLLVVLWYNNTANHDSLKSNHLIWNGGHPLGKQHGSCWCSNYDGYCMCTPSVAIDVIILTTHNNEDHVWLVRRKDTHQLANMGGFVMVGESVEDAVVREIQEEMNLSIQKQSLQLFGVYSDPQRDNRRHTTSAVYVLQLSPNLQPHAADDVKDVKLVPLKDIETLHKNDLFADHLQMLLDYMNGTSAAQAAHGDNHDDIARSLCRKL